MKNKKLLLVASLLALFIFQQAQARASISVDKAISSRLDLTQVNTLLPAQVNVTMVRLNLNDGTPIKKPNGDYYLCSPNDSHYGCVEANSGQQYPYGNQNPVKVDVENDYLLNVLPREMDVVGNPPTLVALQAQALAARSIADWKYRANNGYIDNSTNNQVFVPFSFEYYGGNQSTLNDPSTPCDAVTNKLNGTQQLICRATTSTSGQFVSYGGSSMDAEFGSDMYGETITEPVSYPKPYLKGIQDPISTTCGASNNSNRVGMSQLGADRWSLGNQCATGGSASTSWPVKWSDYRQILVHYYTGIDILDIVDKEI